MKKLLGIITGIVLTLNAFAFSPTDESHPRLFLRAGQEKALMRNIQSDEVWSRMHKAILEECDLICNLPMAERKVVGPRMHAISCEILRRVLFLSYAYRTSGETRYAARAEKEMLHASAFVDWNPSHFLDVAELAAAFGIGYDWLFDYLPQSSKDIILLALQEKAFNPAESDKCLSRFRLRNNWGQVCNGGITMAAIATWTENKAQSRRLVERCSKDIMESMTAGYPPFGCFREGFGYWAFGTQYNILFVDAMEKFFGAASVQQYKDVPGFIESGNYSQQLITPSLRTFGYSDNSTRIYLEPAVMWFNSVRPSPKLFYRQSALFEKFDKTHSYVKTIKNRLIPFMLIWGAGAGEKAAANMQDAEKPQDLFYLGKGDNDICVMRSGWGEDDAYLGFKSGRVNNPHGHMDVGSFYYELDGVRWSLDLGSDDYGSIQTHGIKLFDTKQDSDRWLKLTKYNNFAHSTTYPAGIYQKVDAQCQIMASQKRMQALSDLTALYPGELKSLTRSVALSGKAVVVDDKITADNRDANMVWNMTTEALSLVREGDRLILSAKGGKTLVMDVKCSSSFTAELESAAPEHSFEGRNEGVSFLRLEYSVPAGTSGSIKVIMQQGETHSTDHPRIILRAGEEERMMANIRSDKRWANLHRRVIKEANDLLSKDLQKFKIGARGAMHTQCCEAVRQALFTAYAYRTTGDRRYLDKSEAMALNICNLSSWNPYHFLDVAELTVAASFLYDWCYEGFKPSTRKALVESIKEKALLTSETGGEGNGAYNLRWMDMTSNWSQICHGSMAIGAIAIHDEAPEIADRILRRTLEKMEIPMKAEYPPMGAYSQGIGYWGYGTCLNAIYLDAMEKYFGAESVESLESIPGFMMTGRYYSQLITNAVNNFSFCDNSTSEIMPEHCVFWFYSKTKDASLLYHQKMLVDKYIKDERLTKGSYGRHLPLMMVWGAGTGDVPTADFEKAERPEGLFYLADGINPICTMRGGWEKEDIWVGFKAGNPSCPHGHMDVGEFLIEWDGARFGTDLGSDGYGKINSLKLGSMFNMEEDGMRWNSLLRYNNYSHSTLTVNGAFQKLETKSGFIGFSDDPQNMYTVADLTPSYSDYLESAKRKVSLVNKSVVVVEDELVAKAGKNADVIWNLTTEAEGYSFDAKNGEILLTAKGLNGPKTMRLSINLESGAKYKVERRAVNGELKYPQAEKPADGCYFIRIKFSVKKGTSEKLTCTFSPIEEGPDKAALGKMIDEVFRNAESRYIEFAENAAATRPGRMPHSIRDGKVWMVPPQSWTSGFFPGTLWYIYEYGRNARIKKQADDFTALMASQQHNNKTHDIGFMMYCSYGNSERLEPSADKEQIIMNASDALASRFNPTVGCIRSWDKEVRPGWHYPVIIDNMMNLEMLLWAWKHSGNEKYLNVARTHGLTTMKNHFRPDGSSYHVVNYDPRTGKAVFRGTFQGLADNSSWSRGQGWGLYGNTVLYRYTKDAVFLRQAEKIAAYIMNHPSIPADKIPLWDYMAPANAPRDASAAALYASALLELSEYTESLTMSRKYFNYAVDILKSLSGPGYTAAKGENGGFLLKHSTTAFPLNIEVDQPLCYADYYYLEALLRLKKIINQ